MRGRYSNSADGLELGPGDVPRTEVAAATGTGRGRGRRARCVCRDADHARRPGAVTAFAHGPLRAGDPQSPGEVRGSTVLRSPLAPACFSLLAPACLLSGRSPATMGTSSLCGSCTRQCAESFPCDRAPARAHLRLVPWRFDGSPCRTPAVVQCRHRGPGQACSLSLRPPVRCDRPQGSRPSRACPCFREVRAPFRGAHAGGNELP